MVDATWSTCGAEDCLRVRGLRPGAEVAVTPTSALRSAAAPVAMAGRVVHDDDAICFVPRFRFAAGTSYTVLADGVPAAEVVRPGPDREPTTSVVAIGPDVDEVPRNLLRLSVEFDAPMSEGQAATHVRLVDDDGRELDRPLLAVDDELWDRQRRRLTLLLDPGRIKRGLVPHRTFGYPLRRGTAFRVVVGEGFLDATGTPLRAGASRRYLVADDERRRVDPRSWALSVPSAGTRDPLVVEADRALDDRLLARSLRVTDDHGHLVAGRGAVGSGASSWSFAPAEPWSAQRHHLVVDPRLEDLAGNAVARVFDRDLTEASSDDVRPDGEVLVFRPSGTGAE